MGKIIKNSAGKVLTASGGAFEVTATIDSNITAGNIKKDVTILGVTGTYDAGGGGIEEKDVNFRDYDGTIVASYTAQEFTSLSALPSNPTHTGLTSQGWNWTLADAKTFVAAHGGLEIGQMYVTSDGKTRLYLNLPHPGEIKLNIFMSGNDTGEGSNIVDWGDGATSTPSIGSSHTYETAGEKMITIECRTSRLLSLGTSGNGGIIANGFARSCFYKAELGVRIGIEQAFRYCTNLKSVTMPLGLRNGTLGGTGNSGANFQDTAIKHITIPSDITQLGEKIFDQEVGPNYLHSISLPKGLTTIMAYAFQNIVDVRKLYIPDTVNYFFANNSTITSDGSTIRRGARLEKISLPPNLAIIPKQAFENDTLLDGITLPTGLTGIGEKAFNECYSLSEITIPANVNDIRASAFANCRALTNVYLLPTVPPTLANKNAFPNNPTVLHVPHGYLTAYQTASVWSALSSQMVEMPE